MGTRFAYFYFMKEEPERIRLVIPLHVEYWENTNLNKYSGGPCADRSGGLITFEAADIEEANKIALRDPFVTENLIENKWVKEWTV